LKFVLVVEALVETSEHKIRVSFVSGVHFEDGSEVADEAEFEFGFVEAGDEDHEELLRL
jgi:hypothetical protein